MSQPGHGAGARDGSLGENEEATQETGFRLSKLGINTANALGYEHDVCDHNDHDG